MEMNKEKLQKDIDSFWDNEILPTLIELSLIHI